MTDQQERKFMLTMERLAKAVERVADALEAPVVGLQEEYAEADLLAKARLYMAASGVKDQTLEVSAADLSHLDACAERGRIVGMPWEVAVSCLRDTCKEAPECGPGCVMYEWCQANIPDGPAPYDWKDPPGAGA